MKKIIFLLLFSTFLFSALGCQTANLSKSDITVMTDDQPETTSSETITNELDKVKIHVDTSETLQETIDFGPDEIETIEDKQFCFIGEEYLEIEEYLRSQWENQYGLANEAGINSANQQVSIMIPVVKSTDFELVRIKDNDSALIYTFCPVGSEPIYYGDTNCIEVRYYPYYSSYEHLIQSPQYQFDPQNDAINYFGRWILGIEGYCFEIIFPGTMIDEIKSMTIEQLNELFTFEIRTYSPSVETKIPEMEQYCSSGYESLEEFLQDMWEWEKNNEEYDSSWLNSTDKRISLVIPVLKTNNYKLARVMDNVEGIVFEYDCLDENNNCFMIQIRLWFDPSSYPRLMEYGFDPQNDAVSYPGLLCFGVDGYCFEFHFMHRKSEDVVPMTVEDVDEMFDFEWITYTFSAETHAVQ